MTDSGLEHEIDYSTGFVVKELDSALAQAWLRMGIVYKRKLFRRLRN